jgi:enoyl-CoA hydratase
MADVTLERRGGVALITLRAPERRNALTVDLAQRLIDRCDEADADPEVGAVVVAGEGEGFCAGGDRATLAAAGEDPAAPEAWDGMATIYEAFARVGRLEPPTIAAVRGAAVGAGLNLAMATDLRVVAHDAKLVSGFLPMGLHPGGGHGHLLARAGLRETANAMGLFGQALTGDEAVARGLAWRAVPAGEVEAVALELAAVPGADPALARRTARSLRASAGVPWPAALDLERASQMWSMRRKAL